MTIVRRRNSEIKIESPEDIAGLRVAYQGDTTAQYFTERLRGQGGSGLFFTSFAYDKIINCFNDLRLGRVDLVVADNIVAFHFAGMENSPFEVVWQGPSDEYIAIGLKKGNDLLTDAINKALDELFEDGTMSRISYKYFGSDLVSSIRTANGRD
jgi:polar amino acid transport system substrate-binding protein